MKFIDNLNSIIEELNMYKHDRNELLLFYVNKRLNQSLQVYYHQLCQSMQSLMSIEEMKLIKSLNRYGK